MEIEPDTDDEPWVYKRRKVIAPSETTTQKVTEVTQVETRIVRHCPRKAVTHKLVAAEDPSSSLFSKTSEGDVFHFELQAANPSFKSSASELDKVDKSSTADHISSNKQAEEDDPSKHKHILRTKQMMKNSLGLLLQILEKDLL